MTPVDTPIFWSLVRRVTNRRGSVVVPPLNQEWSDLDKLRWLAATIRQDTGVAVRVRECGYSINGVPVPGHFSLSYPGGAMSGGRFMETWRVLNGIETGARIAKRRAS